MPAYGYGAGKERMWIVTSLSSMTAPSLAQITAGVDVSGFLTKGGFARPRSGNEISVSPVADRENLTIAGSINNGPLSATFRKDDVAGSDAAWNALTEGSPYYIVYCGQGGSGVGGAIAAGDKVEVHHGDCLEKSLADNAENQMAAFTARFTTRSAPKLDATVAA